MEESWKNIIPWYMIILSTIVLICLAIFLVENIEWFKEQAKSSDSWSSDLFQLHIHHIHVSMIKRSVGLFSGFSALFIGMAVCFYTLKQQTNMDLKTGGVSLAVATSSPGIVAMLIGCYLIVSTIDSKDHFDSYSSAVESSSAKDKALIQEINKTEQLFNGG
jgi:p-aminobenzoyl-glutamate transporter AbgT